MSSAAAFGRLCVETHWALAALSANEAAAFGRLCVETRLTFGRLELINPQPPSGGCVLKHIEASKSYNLKRAAAFGRLCVETFCVRYALKPQLAAAFGRLCVETIFNPFSLLHYLAAAFGRLCVETLKGLPDGGYVAGSRLRAAVC